MEDTTVCNCSLFNYDPPPTKRNLSVNIDSMDIRMLMSLEIWSRICLNFMYIEMLNDGLPAD